MQNEKREVVLLSINGVNFLNISKGSDTINHVVTSKKVLFLLFLILSLFSNCHKNSTHDDFENDIELDIMERGSAYLEKGEYDEATLVYSQFMVKFPDHPYVDDAAYRLAYMCVIADIKNPYFDYKNAEILFHKFIENYPNSRYINACNNWINLLNSVRFNNEKLSESSSDEQSNFNEINQLKIELKRVQAENIKLKNTLDELQKAIER